MSLYYNFRNDKGYTYNGTNISGYKGYISSIYILWTCITILIELILLGWPIYFTIMFTTQAFCIWGGFIYGIRVIALIIALCEMRYVHKTLGHPTRKRRFFCSLTLGSTFSSLYSLCIWYVLTLVSVVIYIGFLITEIVVYFTLWKTNTQLYIAIILVIYILDSAIWPSLYECLAIRNPINYAVRKSKHRNQTRVSNTRRPVVKMQIN